MNAGQVGETEETMVGVADSKAHTSGVEQTLVGQHRGALVTMYDRYALPIKRFTKQNNRKLLLFLHYHYKPSLKRLSLLQFYYY